MTTWKSWNKKFVIYNTSSAHVPIYQAAYKAYSLILIPQKESCFNPLPKSFTYYSCFCLNDITEIYKGKIRTKLNKKNLKQNFTAELMNHYAHRFGKIQKVERSCCMAYTNFLASKNPFRCLICQAPITIRIQV